MICASVCGVFEQAEDGWLHGYEMGGCFLETSFCTLRRWRVWITLAARPTAVEQAAKV